jgi:Protein of unknown function (DUF2934)
MSRLIRTTKQAHKSPVSQSAIESKNREQPPATTAAATLAAAAPADSGDAEPSDVVSESDVEMLAYAIWLMRGKPNGTDRQDWFEAKRRLWEERRGMPCMTHVDAAEQTREARERQQARDAGPSIRDRMVTIGRGNQQAGRQGS